MDASARIETALESAITAASARSAPQPAIVNALRYAVFPGGARVRPQLCVAVAAACDEDCPDLTDGAAAAIELIHCASLVHDDLPCFDDAELRRGKTSLHIVHGEPMALLVGDAMIVMAFETLARCARAKPERLVDLVDYLGAAVGVPNGIIAGQSMECETDIATAEYHRAKTGALFSGATMMGAIAAGADPEAWRQLGEKIGAAYQVADDILDMIGNREKLGKPCQRDEGLNRPNAVSDLGMEGAEQKLARLLSEARESIPSCPGVHQLREIIAVQSKRLAPKRLAEFAA